MTASSDYRGSLTASMMTFCVAHLIICRGRTRRYDRKAKSRYATCGLLIDLAIDLTFLLTFCTPHVADAKIFEYKPPPLSVLPLKYVGRCHQSNQVH